jgi:hypothetical protein
VQVYWVFSLAMHQYYWINNQCTTQSCVNPTRLDTAHISS